MKTLVFLAAVATAGYWFVLRGGCGSSGAIACPAPALEEGVGVALNAAEVCPRAGYLCAGRNSFQVARWPLDQGKLRVRVRLPEFVEAEDARQIRDAAIEGIMEWDRHPFPIVIDSGKYTVRMWNIGVVWTQGLYNEAAGQARVGTKAKGKRIEFEVDGLAVVVPPISTGAPLALTPSADPAKLMAQLQAAVTGQEMGPAFLAQIKSIAMHEMGHALGLMHSDSQEDIMFPQLQRGMTQVRASARDLLTVDSLYELPNGAMLR